MHDVQYLRRREPAAYLLSKYGFGAERTLAKGVVTGDSPEFHKAGRLVLYTREALDKWALSKIGAPQRSSSDATRGSQQLAEQFGVQTATLQDKHKRRALGFPDP
jgi:hypothetical protein